MAKNPWLSRNGNGLFQPNGRPALTFHGIGSHLKAIEAQLQVSLDPATTRWWDYDDGLKA